MVTLRDVRYEDMAEIRRWLYPEMGDAEAEETYRAWQTKTYDGRFSEMLAAEADGALVGTVSLYRRTSQCASCGPEIFPPYRRRGYAYAALTLAYERAKELGCAIGVAQIRKDNTASIALHEKLGFERDHEMTTRRGNLAFFYLKSLR